MIKLYPFLVGSRTWHGLSRKSNRILSIYNRSAVYEWLVAIYLVVYYFLLYKNDIINDIINCIELHFSIEGLTSDQIAAEIEDYMDEQLNTILEDNSTVQVAEELLRFYRYCIEGNESTAKVELEKLPPLQSWFTCERPTRSTRSLPVEQDSSSNEDMDVDKSEQDEWTVVTNKRNR